MEDGSQQYKEECIPHYFCDKENKVHWNVVHKSPITLNNWISEYDLICADHMVISSFGMLYFTGFAISSFFLPNMSDRNGRKWYFLGSLLF